LSSAAYYIAGVCTVPALFIAYCYLDLAKDSLARRRDMRRIERKWRESRVSLNQGLTYDPTPAVGWDPPSAALVAETYTAPASTPSSLREFVTDELARAAENPCLDDPHYQMLRRAVSTLKREQAAQVAKVPPKQPRPMGGYTGSTPAKDVPPPPSTPSETIRPRTNRVPNPLVGENLSEYIDGEVRRAAMWPEPCCSVPGGFIHEPESIDPAKIVTGELRIGGVALDCHVGGCRWGAVGSERCECKPAASPIDPDKFVVLTEPPAWPDPAKDDCPVWLPNDPVVPFKDRTPCCLDSGHDGDHEPTSTATYERAVKIARVVKGAEAFDRLTWEAAAARFDRAEARPGAVIG
jgi:hypothetical protein